VKLGEMPTERAGTVNAQEQFEAHDCETFAREHWKNLRRD
jgi:hypothetical protein